MRKVIGAVQQYAWGKKGSESTVAQLVSSEQSVKESEHYAELWMGTHPSGPSFVLDGEQRVLLKDYLGADLPFLFKILSVGEALSIQAHPDKSLAEKLHAQDSKNYKDGNHKPELCCALTNFEALCGFRTVREIASFLQNVQEFRDLFENSVLNDFEDGLDAILEQNMTDKKRAKLCLLFSALMKTTQSIVKEQITKLVNRLSHSSHPLSTESELFLRLSQSYPEDVGCFSVFVLRIVHLQPGEALFLAPNEPHAYLLGDCVEIMASSDNVVRAGLTPKFRDVETLCKMLTYQDDSLDTYMNYSYGKKVHEFVSLYNPPVPEFKLFRIDHHHHQHEERATVCRMNLDEVSVLIIVQGSCQIKHNSSTEKVLERGDICLLPASSAIEITNSGGDHLLIFVATSNNS